MSAGSGPEGPPGSAAKAPLVFRYWYWKRVLPAQFLL
jgi:hypothetical protein